MSDSTKKSVNNTIEKNNDQCNKETVRTIHTVFAKNLIDKGLDDGSISEDDIQLITQPFDMKRSYKEYKKFYDTINDFLDENPIPQNLKIKNTDTDDINDLDLVPTNLYKIFILLVEHKEDEKIGAELRWISAYLNSIVDKRKCGLRMLINANYADVLLNEYNSRKSNNSDYGSISNRGKLRREYINSLCDNDTIEKAISSDSISNYEKNILILKLIKQISEFNNDIADILGELSSNSINTEFIDNPMFGICDILREYDIQLSIYSEEMIKANSKLHRLIMK